MNITENDNRERTAWLTAVACSSVINALVLWLLSSTQEVKAKKQEDFKTVTVDLSLEQIKKEPSIPPLKDKVASSDIKKTAKKRFIETDESQKINVAPANAKNEGAHNTQAASDSKPVVKEAPARANIDGVEPRTRNEIELKNQNLEEGEDVRKPSGIAKPKPNKEEELKRDSSKILSDPLSSEQKNILTEKDEREVSKEKLQERKLEAPLKPLPELVPKPSKVEEELKKEFKAPKEKKRMIGSISRKGEAALDVVDTPLGRYKAELSKAVNHEWLRNCVRYRDHIAPGAFYINFQVGPTGDVSQISITEESTDSRGQSSMGIQKGFTLNALQSANIPAMPKAVKKELKGEALEVMYIFYF